MSTANATGGPGGIRAQRRALGLRQEDLARAAGCSAGYIRMLERGFEPRFSDVLPRIQAALVPSDGDVTADEPQEQTA